MAGQADRVLLLKQELEGGYSDDWSGGLVSSGQGDQVEVHIQREGKSGDFDGILSINCTSQSGYYWKTASDYSHALSEAELAETVPIEVISKAKSTFCR